VWPAAIVLKQYLDSDACISLSDDDAILELGAGTGWLALKMGSR
jgi:16S rRNA A1518/A1519 N6-dimethyltransferase RsmA/KsgA/DIM1 with predicted DNA glycosylase/AP lyase activity